MVNSSGAGGLQVQPTGRTAVETVETESPAAGLKAIADAAAPANVAQGRKERSGEPRWTNWAFGTGAALIALGIWQLASLEVGSSILPGPVAAVQASAQNEYLWSDMAATLYRVVGAFGMAFGAALVVGVLLGISRFAARLLGPLVTVAAQTPALIYVVVALLTVGFTDLGAMVGAGFVVAPSIIYVIWDGVKSLSPELSEMGRAFRVPRSALIRRILLPQIVPAVFTGARTGLSLAWRIMIFVEIFGRSSGVGYRIAYWFNLFQMKRVLGAALPFCIVMMLLEFVILRPLERRLFVWRKAEIK